MVLSTTVLHISVDSNPSVPSKVLSILMRFNLISCSVPLHIIKATRDVRQNIRRNHCRCRPCGSGDRSEAERVHSIRHIHRRRTSTVPLATKTQGQNGHQIYKRKQDRQTKSGLLRRSRAYVDASTRQFGLEMDKQLEPTLPHLRDISSTKSDVLPR